MKLNKILPIIIAAGLVSLFIFISLRLISKSKAPAANMAVSAKFVSSTILVNGLVTAESQANLNFLTPGKLTYLPLKEGDKVSAGQTVAQLDTYALKRQLTQALNLYRSQRDTFDQTTQNAENNVTKAQITYPYDYYAKAGMNNDQYNSYINDAVKRIVDQNQSSLDNSVINVEIANYALQLSRLSSPISGIVVHEDVTTAGVNITPATTFTVADPQTMIFRANVSVQDIYYLAPGSKVSLSIDGIDHPFSGTIERIHPGKVTLPTGQSYYQVDIVSDQLKKEGKLFTNGVATIETTSQNIALVPAWTVLAGKYIWVYRDGKPELKEITSGETHGDQIEILKGLDQSDQIIVDPKFISYQKYQIL